METIINTVAGGISPPHKEPTAIFPVPFWFFENLASPLIKRLSLTSLLCGTWVRVSDSLLTKAAGYSGQKPCCVTLKTRWKRWCGFSPPLPLDALPGDPATMLWGSPSSPCGESTWRSPRGNRDPHQPTASLNRPPCLFKSWSNKPSDDSSPNLWVWQLRSQTSQSKKKPSPLCPIRVSDPEISEHNKWLF